jgi:hypothetical protein
MSVLDTAYKRGLKLRFEAIRKLNSDQLIPADQRHNHTIMDVKEVGFIMHDNKTFLVQEVSAYKETDAGFKNKTGDVTTEFKMFCIETGETVNIEWYDDGDGLEISLSTEQIKLSKLTDDEGDKIDPTDPEYNLQTIAKAQDDVIFSGKTFEFEDHYSSIYCRGGKKEGERVRFYEFEASDGTELTIEEWLDKTDGIEHQVHLSMAVDPMDVEILALGG